MCIVLNVAHHPFEPLGEGPGSASELDRDLMKLIFSGGPSEYETCHAVLDAARIAGLPEILASSDLPHRCLFTGKAAAECADVAPWLVELSSESTLLRNLLTLGSGPQSLWSKQPGTLLVSDLSLDVIYGHLRKYLRVRDEDAVWYYFRFWESQTIEDMVIAHQSGGLARVFAPFTRTLFPQTSSFLEIVADDKDGSTKPPVLLQANKENYVELRAARLDQSIIAHLQTLEDVIPTGDLDTSVPRFTAWGRGFGITEPEDLFNLCLTSHLPDADGLHNRALSEASAKGQSHLITEVVQDRIAAAKAAEASKKRVS